MLVVTGGAGFIGSVVLAQLNQEGERDILVVDNLGKSEKWQNLVKRSFLDYMPREEFYERLCKENLPDIDAIVHLGACSSTTERDCDFLYQNNVVYTKTLCRYCFARGIRLIIASSAATYGNGKAGFSDAIDKLPLLRPLNMYGYSKHLIDTWLAREGLLSRVASLKFFNVYGPNEYHKGSMRSVVVKAYEEITRTGTLSLFASTEPGMADGEQRRDFVYVKDCARLISWLLAKPDVCGIYNVGCGRARTFNALGAAVFAAMGLEKAITYVPMPAHLVGKYQSYTCADMAWLAKMACPITFTTLEDGVRDYVQHYLATEDPYV